MSSPVMGRASDSLSLTCQPAQGHLFCHSDQFHVGRCSPAVEADPWSLWPLFLFLDPDEALYYEAWSLALWKVPGYASQKGRTLTLCG